MKLEPKALEAAEAALQEMHFDSYGMIDEIAEAAITAALRQHGKEPSDAR